MRTQGISRADVVETLTRMCEFLPALDRRSTSAKVVFGLIASAQLAIREQPGRAMFSITPGTERIGSVKNVRPTLDRPKSPVFSQSPTSVDWTSLDEEIHHRILLVKAFPDSEDFTQKPEVEKLLKKGHIVHVLHKLAQ